MSMQDGRGEAAVTSDAQSRRLFVASVAITMPILGGIYDSSGPATALRSMAILPFTLLLIFGFSWFRDRARGGYKAENLLEERARETQGASARGRTAPGQTRRRVFDTRVSRPGRCRDKGLRLSGLDRPIIRRRRSCPGS